MLQPLPKKIGFPAAKCWIIFLILAAFFVLPKISSAAGLTVNEIMYDLAGADDKHEWVELYNGGATDIDLANWKFNDGSNHKLNPPPDNGSRGSLVLPAGGYLLLADDAATLAADLPDYSGTIIDTVMDLNNVADSIKTINPDGQEITVANYTSEMGAAGNGKTLSWDGATFKESSSDGGTPGRVNDFSSGTLTPSLSPSPSPSSSPTPGSSPSPSQSAETIPSATPETSNAPKFQYSADIFLSEFFPYPESGSPEWVEIYNAGDAAINLTGWSLMDGAEHNLAIADQTTIAAGQYLVIALNQSLLNNDGDQIELLWPDGQTIHSVAYQKVKQNYACARFNGQWLWTNQPTPGSANKKSFSAQSPSSPAPSPTPAVSIPATPRPSAVLKEETAADFSSSQPTAKKETMANEKPIADQSSLDLTASAQEPIKNSSFKSALALIAVVLFAGLTAGGLIYFKKQKQVDIENQDT